MHSFVCRSVFSTVHTAVTLIDVRPWLWLWTAHQQLTTSRSRCSTRAVAKSTESQVLMSWSRCAPLDPRLSLLVITKSPTLWRVTSVTVLWETRHLLLVSIDTTMREDVVDVDAVVTEISVVDVYGVTVPELMMMQKQPRTDAFSSYR